MGVMVASPVDIVVFHEEHHRRTNIGEDLPIGVVE